MQTQRRYDILDYRSSRANGVKNAHRKIQVPNKNPTKDHILETTRGLKIGRILRDTWQIFEDKLV